MKKKILKTMILVFLIGCKNTNENKLVIANIEKEIVVPLKVDSTTCKYGLNIWTVIQNNSKDSIYFYRPADIFFEKKNGIFKESNEFLNQVPIPCPIFKKSGRMLNWFKIQAHHNNLTEKLLDSTLKDSDINRNLIGNFFFLAPKESIVYPYIIEKKLLYETKIIVKSDPKILQGLGTAYDEKKFGKLPDKFMGYKYWSHSFTSNTIHLNPTP
jgi:hypothetical protein